MWEPLIQGCVAKNCHPLGCQRAVAAQIAYVQQQPRFAGPKRVLILGASFGFGLAARIVLAVGGGRWGRDPGSLVRACPLGSGVWQCGLV